MIFDFKFFGFIIKIVIKKYNWELFFNIFCKFNGYNCFMIWCVGRICVYVSFFFYCNISICMSVYFFQFNYFIFIIFNDGVEFCFVVSYDL